MELGEVGLLTNDVVRLANFYKALLRVENGSDDSVHQFILTEGTGLSIYNDGVPRNGNFQNITFAFTVDDVHDEFERVKSLGATITSPPTVQPWGVTNMVFLDSDGNQVIFRSIP